LFQIHTP